MAKVPVQTVTELVRRLNCGFARLVGLLFIRVAERNLNSRGASGQTGRWHDSRAAGICGGLALVVLFAATGARSQEAEPEYDIYLPEQDATSALEQLAEQTGALTLFPYDLAAGRTTNAVVGRYTLPHALELLLTDTGLSGGLSEKRVISINAIAAVERTEEVANVEQEIGGMGTSNNNGVLAAVLGFFVGVGGAQQASAQDDGQAEARVLEEVVVTARKREESLIDVPVAISAFSEASLLEAGIDEMGDVLDNTAGMVYNERDGNRSQAYPGVRGIKNFVGGGSARVSTFVDSMPVAGPQASIQFVDVAGVEVYRGPQSAVFGRSVFAGAINYILREPSLDAQSGAINGQLGQDGRSLLSGWYSAPVVEDTVGFYVSASKDSYDGPGGVLSTDGYKMGNRDTTYYSAALTFEPTDNFRMTLRATHTQLDDGPAPDYNLDPAGDRNIVLSPTRGRAPLYFGELNYVEDAQLRRNFCYNEGMPDQNCIRDPGWELERNRLSFDASLGLDNGHSLTFRAFGSDDFVFDHDDQDNTDEAFGPMSVVNMGNESDIEEQYVEVVWNSPDDQRLRYTVGVSKYDYYQYREGYFIHPSATIDGMGSAPGIGTTDVSYSGVFGGLFYDLTDNLTISLEGRQQEDAIVANDPNPDDDNVPESISDTFLPRLALTYAVSDTLNLYAQFAEGVQPATINTQAVGTQQRAIAAAFEGLEVNGVTYSSQVPFLDDVLAVDEEVLTSYEVGLKGTFLDGRLNLGAALFRIETDGYAEVANLFFFPEGSDSNSVLNALEAVGTATGNGLLLNLSDTSVRVRGSVNIADVRSNGLELEGVYLLGDNWEIAGHFTQLNTSFGTGCAPVGANFGLPLRDLVLASGGTMACTDISGNDFPFIPPIQYGLAATYRDQLANGWDWFTRLDMRYEDEQYMDWFEAGWLPASTKLNFRAGVNAGRLRGEFYIVNLTDDRTPLGAQYEPDRKEVANFTGNRGPTNNTGLNVALAYPREAGLRFSLNF